MATATTNSGGITLTRRERARLYIAVVAAATGRLMQGKPNREERELTGHEAHEQGLVAIRKAQNGVKRRASR